MKRSIFLAAVATLAAGSALAQSSVTVYGRLNVTGERFRANNTTTYLLNDNASRIGFKGFEDLGGGMYAAFLLESRVKADTGGSDTSAFWGRESWVALGGAFGKVRLGNMGPTNAYFTTADYVSMHNHDTGTSSDAIYVYDLRSPRAQGVLGSTNGFTMRNTKNMIAYTSPSISGLKIDAQLGLSEGDQVGRTYVLTGNYDTGPLHLGASFLQENSGLSNTVIPRQYGLRALYELGDFTFGGYYVRDDGVFVSAPGAGKTKRDAYRAAVMYTMGPGEFHLNFGYASAIKNNLVTGDTVKQATLAYNYNLSKRTKVYTYYTRVNDPKGVVSFNTGVANSYGTFALGVRHNF